MSDREMIEVELTFRSEAEGGRRIPEGILSGCTYRPHIVVGSPEQRHAVVADGNHLTESYLGVGFVDGPAYIEPGQPCIAQAVLAFWPAPEYAAVVPGAGFTLREGAHIVGHGYILRRWSESTVPPNNALQRTAVGRR